MLCLKIASSNVVATFLNVQARVTLNMIKTKIMLLDRCEDIATSLFSGVLVLFDHLFDAPSVNEEGKPFILLPAGIFSAPVILNNIQWFNTSCAFK